MHPCVLTILTQHAAALAAWLNEWECRPTHRKVAGSIPSWGTYGRQPIDVSLSHPCFSRSKKSIKLSLGKDIK